LIVSAFIGPAGTGNATVRLAGGLAIVLGGLLAGGLVGVLAGVAAAVLNGVLPVVLGAEVGVRETGLGARVNA
jgi:hypothetical protein